MDPGDDLPSDAGEWRDTDGDGIGNNQDADDDGDGVYLVAASDLAALDAADGLTDRAIGLGHVTSGANSWKIVGGDGRTDHLMGNPQHSLRDSRGAIHLLLTADISGLDRADGLADRRMMLENLAGDTDGDGTTNTFDRDDDDDGFEDDLDGFPLDPAEWADTDGDGVAEYNSNNVAFDGDGNAELVVGAPDGAISLENTTGTAGSFTTPPILRYDPAYEMTDLADFDGDGLGDIVLEVVPSGKGRFYRAAYLINAADLPHLDAADGNRDGRIFLTSMVRPRR